MRFIMLEAEMPEGDLTQITTAIQNALRPSQVDAPRVAKTHVKMIGPDGQDQEVVEAVVDVEHEDHEPEAASAPRTTPRQRKPAKRKVLNIDLDSETSFTSFLEQYPPKTDQDKYLTAVAFLSEHRKEVDGITADHVYTCFRKAGWSVGTKDFGQPLRNLKQNQFLDQGPKTGTYVVNHIGLDKVHKLAES